MNPNFLGYDNTLLIFYPLLQIAEAKAAGQARKEEAIRRREEFVQIKQSEAKLVSSKSVQQLNAEREEMIAHCEA